VNRENGPHPIEEHAMSHCLLSTYTVEGGVPGTSPTPEQMQTFMERVIALEAEMDEQGAFISGAGREGRCSHEPSHRGASVPDDGRVKDHMGGASPA
jgi:hypothetical protein